MLKEKRIMEVESKAVDYHGIGAVTVREVIRELGNGDLFIHSKDNYGYISTKKNQNEIIDFMKEVRILLRNYYKLNKKGILDFESTYLSKFSDSYDYLNYLYNLLFHMRDFGGMYLISEVEEVLNKYRNMKYARFRSSILQSKILLATFTAISLVNENKISEKELFIIKNSRTKLLEFYKNTPVEIDDVVNLVYKLVFNK